LRSKYSRKRLALVALIVGSCLRVQENSDRANRPMLLVVPGDDCDALYLLLVIFHESSMIFKGRDILPAVEPGSINQRIDLRRNLAKVVSLHFAGAMILNTLPEIMSVLIMRNLLQSKPDAAAVSWCSRVCSAVYSSKVCGVAKWSGAARNWRRAWRGRFIVDLEARSVDLLPGQGFVVPKGVIHCTRAPERSVILMVETAAIVPTGDT